MSLEMKTTIFIGLMKPFSKQQFLEYFFYHSQNKLTTKFSDKAWHSGRNLTNNSVTTFYI